MHDHIPSLLSFLKKSPTPFHAVENLVSILNDAGFVKCEESDNQLKNIKKGYLVRGGSAILAFKSGSTSPTESGIRFVGAHTDSPCLKVKPNPDKYIKGYHLLKIQPYGGVLLAPWFDRDLSLAGHVVYEDVDGRVRKALIDFERPLGCVPSLAIHLDRTANENRSINAHNEMSVLLGAQVDSETGSGNVTLDDILVRHIAIQKADLPAPKTILGHDLSFYDCQPPAEIGMSKELLTSARLDNLLSSYLGVIALIASDDKQNSVFISNDHEEVGSASDVGAKGPMLKNWFESYVPGAEHQSKTLARSLMISVDNAHGVHPNFVNKHDENLGPILNMGPVFKYDVNQSYATSSVSSGVLKWLADKAPSIPLQQFAVRSDMRCGSTIGPITSTLIGLQTVDIGNPTFGMHSIRETAGVKDVKILFDLLVRFNDSSCISI